MREELNERLSERGEAGTKLLFVLVILFLAGHAGWNYVPVAYQSENFKQDMQTAVIQGVSMPMIGVKPNENVKNRIIKAARENNIPEDAVIQVVINKGMMQAHVSYTKKVELLPFGLYEYPYQFDHTAMPTGYMMKTSF
ncbi:MAG TPA: hypothetical protein PKY59_22175 [Pyrinomonadaceae bacterium]|nr:hypothetical protein [Pyrinomonadaceae bacterium]